MAVNLDKPQRWKKDIARSVDLYNKWFLKFAPRTYREERGKASKLCLVERTVYGALQRTSWLRTLQFFSLSECAPLHP